MASEDFGSPILHVPDYQWEYMRQYVRDCANIMGLRDWTCNYYKERPEDVSHEIEAGIMVSKRRPHFTIWVPLEWFRKAGGNPADRAAARQTIAHELLHACFRDLHYLHESLQTNLGDHVWGVYNDIHEEIEERVIDALANWVDKCLPLPRLPNKPPADIATGVAFRANEI